MNKNITIEELIFLKESNAIEGVYDVDSLMQSVYAWQDLLSKEEMTSGVILKTHKTLMLHQKLMPNEKGYFRDIMVYVGNKPMQNPETIRESIGNWCNKTMKSRQSAKKLHVEFEAIHPFVDGNGRVGRMLMNWTRLKKSQEIFPLVSCGSDLGILPGDVSEKFGPYMAPIMDVFNKRIGKSGVESYIKNGRIKQIPLQLLRGASIDNATILLDEAQNCDSEQLIMLLTRIGKDSTLIINGDLRQKDIKNSGLQHVLDKVSHIREIEHIHLTTDDIVRSDIVKDIVMAFWGDDD